MRKVNWTTLDEERFIYDMLSGDHQNRLKVIRQYLKIADNRKDWGGIDKKKVIGFAKRKEKYLVKILNEM